MQLFSILAVVDSGIMLLINMLLNQKKLPKYCQSFFPKEDQIIDFINPWHDDEIVKVIKEFSDWYPVDILEPRL